jgi:hypothetical protein
MIEIAGLQPIELERAADRQRHTGRPIVAIAAERIVRFMGRGTHADVD